MSSPGVYNRWLSLILRYFRGITRADLVILDPRHLSYRSSTSKLKLRPSTMMSGLQAKYRGWHLLVDDFNPKSSILSTYLIHLNLIHLKGFIPSFYQKHQEWVVLSRPHCRRRSDQPAALPGPNHTSTCTALWTRSSTPSVSKTVPLLMQLGHPTACLTMTPRLSRWSRPRNMSRSC
jgi:hypothetical protein